MTTYFAIFLGYGTQLLAMMSFYVIASVWFVYRRYRYVRRGQQFTMPWPRPVGYQKQDRAPLSDSVTSQA